MHEPDDQRGMEVLGGGTNLREKLLRLCGRQPVQPLKALEYSPRHCRTCAATWTNGFNIDPINLYMEMRDAGALTGRSDFQVLKGALACYSSSQN
jgi:hypothetical protein